jgi:hypothetical protein
VSRFLRRREAGPQASLGLSATDLALCWRESGRDDAQCLAAQCRRDTVLQVLAGWVNDSPALAKVLRRCPLRISVTDELVRWWLVNALEGTRSLNELEALARMRHEELFGQSIDGWSMQAQWNANGFSVCTAVPRDVVQLAIGMRAELGISAGDLRPAAERLWGQWTTRDQADVLVTSTADDHAQLWWFEHGRLVDLRSIRMLSSDAGQRLSQELMRMGAKRVAGAAQEKPTSTAILLRGKCDARPLNLEVPGMTVREFGAEVSSSICRQAAPGACCATSAHVAARLGLYAESGHGLVAIH